MTENPYSAPVSSDAGPVGDDSHHSWQSVTQPLRNAAGWHRLLGFMFVGIGALYCLTIVGAIIGWVPMWIGILLLKSGDNFKIGTAESTSEGVAQLAKIVRIVGTASIVLFGLMILYFVCILAVFALMRFSYVPPPA